MSVENWESRSLTQLAEYINGYAFKPDDWEEEGLPIIRIEQLKNPDTICDYYSGNIPRYNIIDDGDLIFSWSASLFLRVWERGLAALNQHLFKVEPYDNVDKHFLKFLIEFYLPEITKASHGSTMQHITRKELHRFRALVPVNKQEQTQIATILSTIDRAIEQTEALIAKQQRIKTGLMQDLLTKGIDENGNIRSEETHEFKDSPLGRIPVEWEVVTTGQVTKSLVPGRDKPDLDGGGVPWITIPDIEGMYLDLPKSGLSLSLNAIKVANARLMPKGTVLMSCVGEFGIATITECDAVANQQLHGFICDQSILPEWLIAQINASGNRIDNMATQTTIKYLNKNGCESILITLPSLKEQVKIISILDNINDLFEKQKKSLNKLRSLKTGLMQDLLTGKVRVTELIKERETDNL
jgi:type I restriction enzyme S subunit